MVKSPLQEIFHPPFVPHSKSKSGGENVMIPEVHYVLSRKTPTKYDSKWFVRLPAYKFALLRNPGTTLEHLKEKICISDNPKRRLNHDL